MSCKEAILNSCKAADMSCAAHIKALLQGGRQPAIDAYTRIIQSIRDEKNFSGSIHKKGTGTSTTSKSLYLCLQCPLVGSTPDKHKNHAFGKQDTAR